MVASLYVNYNGSLFYPVNFIVDSIYFNSIVLLTIWIVYSSNWNSIRLCLNMFVSILKHSACHIWISLTKILLPLRVPQNICGIVILFIYIAFSIRNSSLMSWFPSSYISEEEHFFLAVDYYLIFEVSCHNLTKQLSYYLYLLYFTFLLDYY